MDEEESRTFEEYLNLSNFKFYEEFEYSGIFDQIEYRNFIEERRWVTSYEDIYKHKETGRFLSVQYELGNTEYQENGETMYIQEVKPTTVTKIEYVAIG